MGIAEPTTGDADSSNGAMDDAPERNGASAARAIGTGFFQPEADAQRDWKTAFVTRQGASGPADPNAGLRLTLPAAAKSLPAPDKLARR